MMGSSAATQPRMTMARTIKLFKLPAEPVTPGLRPMERRDIPQARPAAVVLSASAAVCACHAVNDVPRAADAIIGACGATWRGVLTPRAYRSSQHLPVL